MKAFGCWPLITALATGVACGQTSIELRGGDQKTPTLAHTCLITKDVQRLVDFYEPVLQQKAKWSGKDYAEFSAGGGGVGNLFGCSARAVHPGFCRRSQEQKCHSGVSGSRCRS